MIQVVGCLTRAEVPLCKGLSLYAKYLEAILALAGRVFLLLDVVVEAGRVIFLFS